MQVLVVLAHPDGHSFNHAIARTAIQSIGRNGHEVTFHDLYAENFDPVLTKQEIPQDGEIPALIRKYCHDLSSADGVVIVHPNWWGQPPAILKGWIDRVFRPGAAYNFLEGDQGDGIPVGLLKAKAAVVFNTSNTPAQREHQVFGDPLEALWRACIFDLCGVNTFYRRMFNVVVTSTAAQRDNWLAEVEETIGRYFPAV